MLFNEPKLLKNYVWNAIFGVIGDFSALQRAEIAENAHQQRDATFVHYFSALQRAEIAENNSVSPSRVAINHFSALQRAEIAENLRVSGDGRSAADFSALQRAEIAENRNKRAAATRALAFQCSSTSRNC